MWINTAFISINSSFWINAKHFSQRWTFSFIIITIIIFFSFIYLLNIMHTLYAPNAHAKNKKILFFLVRCRQFGLIVTLYTSYSLFSSEHILWCMYLLSEEKIVDVVIIFFLYFRFCFSDHYISGYVHIPENRSFATLNVQWRR